MSPSATASGAVGLSFVSKKWFSRRIAETDFSRSVARTWAARHNETYMTKNQTSSLTTVPQVERRILVIRGQKVMIDADLAELYGVPTKALNQAVKRNAERFPADFMFQLSAVEKAEVVTNCDHLVRLKFSKALPYAFTEHGAIQASNVLASPQAVEMGVYVVRAFVRLREVLASSRELAAKLDALEQKTERLSLQHETFAGNTRVQLKQVFEALRQLMAPPAQTDKRPIGFITSQEKRGKRRGRFRVSAKHSLSRQGNFPIHR